MKNIIGCVAVIPETLRVASLLYSIEVTVLGQNLNHLMVCAKKKLGASKIHI